MKKHEALTQTLEAAGYPLQQEGVDKFNRQFYVHARYAQIATLVS